MTEETKDELAAEETAKTSAAAAGGVQANSGSTNPKTGGNQAQDSGATNPKTGGN